MNKKEFGTIAMALRTYFPKENILPNEQAMELWWRQLQDLDYSTVEMGLNKWVATQKWSPTIADIREMAVSVQEGARIDWAEGWQKVLHAISFYGYYKEQEALESMDETTRRACQQIGFRNICMSDNITADRANFRMAFETIDKRRKQDAQLPQKLREMIAQKAAGLIEG